MIPFTGKSVLVTGAGGSIGSQLCEQIVRAGAKRLTMLSLTEGALYTVTKALGKLKGETELVGVLGSAGDTALLQEALTGLDTVVHAAAHKHLPLCESNPIAAIENNALTTHRLMRWCEVAGVKQFCFISTDKAVKPTSVLGMTKRLAEMLVRSSYTSETMFCVVRFGNVLDSAGSVMPLWREQIANGGPVTLTDERCERYFMSIPEAVSLVMQAMALPEPIGTFVLDMGEPRKLIDIARELIGDKDIRIECTGLRAGEKLTEELHHGGELFPTGVQRVFSVDESSPQVDGRKLQNLQAAVRLRDKDRALKLLRDLVA